MSSYNSKKIKDWQEDDRPRERLLKHGPGSLSDSELLAIILRTGTKKMNAKQLGEALLEHFGKFPQLEKSDIADIMKIKGIGEAKAITLSAVFEIARRTKAQPFERNKIVRSPEDISKIYIPKLRNLQTEEFRVILLSAANVIIKDVQVSGGTLNASIVHPREVFKKAISAMAASIILLHNHPSGNPEPSQEDIKITKQLVDAGNLLDIKVIDHIIIAGENYYSFVSNGKL